MKKCISFKLQNCLLKGNKTSWEKLTSVLWFTDYMRLSGKFQYKFFTFNLFQYHRINNRMNR